MKTKKEIIVIDDSDEELSCSSSLCSSSSNDENTYKSSFSENSGEPSWSTQENVGSESSNNTKEEPNHKRKLEVNSNKRSMEDNSIDVKKEKVLLVDLKQPKVTDSKKNMCHRKMVEFSKPKPIQKFKMQDLESTSKSDPKCDMRNFASFIPKWKDNEIFSNQRTCKLSLHKPCNLCLKLMFSPSLRGKPIADLSWFHDHHNDHVINPKFRYNRDIFKKVYGCITNHELQLRKISRQRVFDDLVKRFRGYHNSQQLDSICILLNDYNFRSIKDWCNWKDSIDFQFACEYNKQRDNHIFYCTGCGDKCYRFQSRSTQEYYQRCSNNKCSFFHKEGTNFARIKK